MPSAKRIANRKFSLKKGSPDEIPSHPCFVRSGVARRRARLRAESAARRCHTRAAVDAAVCAHGNHGNGRRQYRDHPGRIPAPAAGLYNYVCSLAYDLSNDTTGTVVTNVVTTSTNFGTFALKVSQTAVASVENFSVVPGPFARRQVASSPPRLRRPRLRLAGIGDACGLTWIATYYQAP
jgi:hypothetical protein